MAFGKRAAISLSLAVVIIGGGGFAAYSVMNNGTDIATIVPSNALAFANLDSSPSISQGKSALSFIDKVNEAIPNKEKDEKIHITGDHFEGLDEESLNAWLGDDVAWVIPENAIPDNALASATDISGARATSSKDSLKSVAIYAVKDKAKAQESIDAMNNEKADPLIDVEKFFYTIDGKFMYVTDSQETYDKYKADLEKGNIAEDANYKKDKELLSDNVGYAWTDFGKILETVPADERPEVDFDGRAVASISFDNDGMTLDTKFVDLLVDGKPAEKIDSKNTGSVALEALPTNTMIGFGVADLSESIKKGWDEAVKQEASIQEYATQAESYLGIKVPDELDKLLGDNTAFGMSSDEKIFMIANNSDKATTERVVTQLSEGMGEEVNVTDKDSLVIVSNSTLDSSLKDHELYKSVLPEAAKSQFSMWFNIAEMGKMDKTGENDTSKLGVMGMTGNHDYDKNVTSFKVRWVL